MPLLELRDLEVAFETREGTVRAVNGVTLGVDRGRTLGLVGESGSGKDGHGAHDCSGSRARRTRRSRARCCSTDVDLVPLPENALRAIRGRRLAMVFQDPLSSLHPMYRVGWQIDEAIRAHEKVGKRAARARTVELLRSVGIPSPEERVDAYPHELSGGMRQRVMIAMALALGPDLLIADEPTSALDVTVQSQILELLAELQRETGMALLLVSHDFGVISENADEVVVMYAGRVVEHGTREQVIGAPIHPYTRGLLDSIPHVDGPRAIQLDAHSRRTAERGEPAVWLRIPSALRARPRVVRRARACPLAERQRITWSHVRSWRRQARPTRSRHGADVTQHTKPTRRVGPDSLRT